MKPMIAGVTKRGEGLDGLSWNILGQTYVPKQLSEHSFAWEAILTDGTFVPPHVHPTQDEFIWVLEGRFDLLLDGAWQSASAGDLIRLPMKVPHGIFNKSGGTNRCVFWVAPTRRLFDLFTKIHNVPDPQEVVRLAAEHEVDFLPPPAQG